jgi:hypothetical protein
VRASLQKQKQILELSWSCESLGVRISKWPPCSSDTYCIQKDMSCHTATSISINPTQPLSPARQHCISLCLAGERFLPLRLFPSTPRLRPWLSQSSGPTRGRSSPPAASSSPHRLLLIAWRPLTIFTPPLTRLLSPSSQPTRSRHSPSPLTQ